MPIDMVQRAMMVMLGIIVLICSILGCYPDPGKAALDGSRPIGSVMPLIDGKEVFVYDAYPLHDDYLKFTISTRPPTGWDVTRTYYQVDSGQRQEISKECVTFYQKLPTDCKWKNPRDGATHTITFVAYYGMVNEKEDKQGQTVRLSNGEAVLDTIEHGMPATHDFKVFCYED